MHHRRLAAPGAGGKNKPATKRTAALFFCYAAAVMLSALPTACKDDNMTNAINDIKRQNEAQLMALPGVVSVGVGRAPDGKPAIIVGLRSADPAVVQQVPNEIKGYPVIVQTVGTIKAR